MSLTFGSIRDDLRTTQEIAAMSDKEVIAALFSERAVIDSLLVSAMKSSGYSRIRTDAAHKTLGQTRDRSYAGVVKRVMSLTEPAKLLEMIEARAVLLMVISREIQAALEQNARTSNASLARKYLTTDHEIGFCM